MAWTNETTGTQAGVTGALEASLGTAIAVSGSNQTVTISAGAHVMSGTGSVQTISGGRTNQYVTFLLAAGSAISFVSGGNIVGNSGVRTAQRSVTFFYDGTNYYDTMSSSFAAANISNTPAGTITSTDVQSALNELDTLKAPKASPTFTGTVVVPTPFTLGATSVTATGTEINRLVGVTSGVQAQIDLKAPLASPTFTGTPAAPTATSTTNTTQIATTAMVQSAAITKADVAAGTFGLRSAKFQDFYLWVVNTGGTIQHRITGEFNAATAALQADKINGASTVLANTPTVTAGVGFTSGGGLVSGSTHNFLLDTADQAAIVGYNPRVTVASGTTAGVTPLVACQLFSSNINGVTRTRLNINCTDNTGAAITLSTATIAAGKQIVFHIFGDLL